MQYYPIIQSERLCICTHLDLGPAAHVPRLLRRPHDSLFAHAWIQGRGQSMDPSIDSTPSIDRPSPRSIAYRIAPTHLVERLHRGPEHLHGHAFLPRQLRERVRQRLRHRRAPVHGGQVRVPPVLPVPMPIPLAPLPLLEPLGWGLHVPALGATTTHGAAWCLRLYVVGVWMGCSISRTGLHKKKRVLES